MLPSGELGIHVTPYLNFIVPLQSRAGPVEPLQWWYLLVEHYQRRQITKAEDRLPAIGGLAEHFAQKIRTKYLAGLWEQDLHRGLLWIRVAEDSSTDYSTQVQRNSKAPTWSWASGESPVRYHFEPYDRKTRVPWKRVSLARDQDLDIKHVNFKALHGPFGEIEEGTIFADALMKHFCYKTGLKSSLATYIVTYYLDEEPSTTDLWVILVGSWVDEDLEIRAFCLILARVNKNHAYFRRIGVGWTSLQNSRGLRTGNLTKEERRRVSTLFNDAKRTQIVLV